MAQQRTSVSAMFGFEKKPWLLLWFCRHFLASHLYYWEAKNLYLILRFEEGRVDLLDIIGQQIPEWSELAPVIPMTGPTEIRCYFVPDKLGVSAESVDSPSDRFFFDAGFPLPELICVPETQRG